MAIRVQRLRSDAILPVRATPGAACFDLHAVESVTLFGGGQKSIGTGLAFEVREGHVMLLFSRSGHAKRHRARLGNCVGVVDSDYRGEVRVMLTRDYDPDDRWGSRLTIVKGERIAQALILPVPEVVFLEAQQLSATERGEGGFGSTGT